MPAPTAPLPRILFLISHVGAINPPSPLAVQVSDVVETYAGQARIEVADCRFVDILAFAEQAEREGRADIFICAGATGAFLKRKLSTGVVLMQLSGHDILYALHKAHETLGRVAVAQYDQPLVELDYIRSLWGVDISQGTYKTLEDARTLLARFERQGYSVIIGSSIVTQIAGEFGLTGILSTSPVAITRAIDEALATLSATRAETEKRVWINTTLRHLTQGVVAIDSTGVVQAANPAVARVLETPLTNWMGQDIDALAPALNLKTLLAADADPQTKVVQQGATTVLASLYPMRDDANQLVGAVAVCQDAVSVEGADRQLRINTKRSEHRSHYQLDQIIGSSHVLRSQIALAHRYAQTDATVLILGESGTGKELFAQGIHSASARAIGPFVAINCASLPESLLESELFGYEDGAFTGAKRGGKPGLIEQAHRGTLFLDEIGDMPLSLQTRLLRVLQEREVVRLGSMQPTPVNLRVIAATHRDLSAEIRRGNCREDLYYRLNILKLRLPALRERREDLRDLAIHILSSILLRDGLHLDPNSTVDQLMPMLNRHTWPGNVRELGNVMERAALLFGDDQTLWSSIDLESTLLDTGDAAPNILTTTVAPSLESETLATAIERNQGNLTRAAQSLGISRTTLWRRLKAARSES